MVNRQQSEQSILYRLFFLSQEVKKNKFELLYNPDITMYNDDIGGKII